MGFATVFPGQGSQSVGMLGQLAEAFPIVRQTFEEASAELHQDMWQLVSAGPQDALNRTENTQPAMLAAGVAVWRVWEQLTGIHPVVMAGHSLGEYTALVCAGALDFHAALKLVRVRAQVMQNAVAQGAGSMAAILGLDDDRVHQACVQGSDAKDRVAVANFNAPGQVVIAGHRVAVERAVECAKKLGAKRAIVLEVSVPSHCELMRPAACAFQETLAASTVRTPRFPVINNVDVVADQDPARIKDALVRQLYSPVRWVETVRAMRGYGAIRAIESGPGKVLAGLIKRIDKDMTSWCVADEAVMREAAVELTPTPRTERGGSAGFAG